MLDVDLAPPGPDEIAVRIAAGGKCRSEPRVRRGEWVVSTPLVRGPATIASFLSYLIHLAGQREMEI